MELTWNYTAQSYLDQLSSPERAGVLQAVQQLPANWDTFDGSRLKMLAGDEAGLFVFRVGSDLRVLVQRQGDVITIVDVVRKRQIDGLRRVFEEHPAALG